MVAAHADLGIAGERVPLSGAARYRGNRQVNSGKSSAGPQLVDELHVAEIPRFHPLR
jgi:hypothetical protein